MIKTDRYVQTEAVGMLYRLIPVTEEIIRCVIGKEEIKGTFDERKKAVDRNPQPSFRIFRKTHPKTAVTAK